MSADEPYVPTEEDIQSLGSLCIYMAANAAPKWWNVPSDSVLKWVSDYYLTTAEPNQADIMAEIGWNEDYMMLFDGGLGLNLSDLAPFYADLLTIVPHPKVNSFIIPVFGAFTAITTIILALRLWSRISVAGKLGSFDWATVVAYFLIIAWGALAVHESTAVGEWGFYCDQTWTEAHSYERAYDILTFTYPIAILAIKVSLLLFYHQLSAWRPLRISVYVTGFICFANSMCGIFLWVYQCNVPNLWDYMADFMVAKTCKLDQMTVLMATGGVGIFTDVVIWLIPIPMVWQLQLNTRERILAVCTFGVGLVACVGSVMRLVAIRQLLYYGNVDGNDSRDPINAWAVVEMNLALICACVPALRALAIKHIPRIVSRTSDGTDVSKNSKGSSSYKEHGKPSIVSDEDQGTNASELGDYPGPRNSNTEKPESNVKVWSPITNYKTDEYSRMRE
ncbi:hypothetical protein DRE_00433 [Drechslerella stenobrocha 248]|uniref:Rhodopsin domain-containing protein n=1 Tax=Drechslerella stenobrocha 248 TaxID=1043628 RepID=W7IEQ1_9PEZI|nr:hypothetical protein DRE_00433 [Drechslerella stenobrocha 248]